jgi:hypothetical protein
VLSFARASLPCRLAFHGGRACLPARQTAGHISLGHTAPYQHTSPSAVRRVLRDPTRLGLSVFTALKRPTDAPSPSCPLQITGQSSGDFVGSRRHGAHCYRTYCIGWVGTVASCLREFVEDKSRLVNQIFPEPRNIFSAIYLFDFSNSASLQFSIFKTASRAR